MVSLSTQLVELVFKGFRHVGLEREWERIWRRSWLLAGLESDLREPGGILVFDLGREQILATKVADGHLRTFNDVWLSDDELRVQHFHNELDRLMAG